MNITASSGRVNVGCKMRVQNRFGGMKDGGPKIKAGCGILKILVAGYGMKLSWRDRDSLLCVGGMWDILNLKGGCGMT